MSYNIIVLVSFKSGTFKILDFPGTIKLAAIIGKTAFLAPLIVTSPANGEPPFIINLFH